MTCEICFTGVSVAPGPADENAKIDCLTEVKKSQSKTANFKGKKKKKKMNKKTAVVLARACSLFPSSLSP